MPALDLGWARGRLLRIVTLVDRAAAVASMLGRVGGAREVSVTDMQQASYLTDAVLERICRLRQVRSVTLRACTGLTDAGLAHLPGLHHHLASLTLAGCFKTTDAGLEHVGQLQRLTTLHLVRARRHHASYCCLTPAPAPRVPQSSPSTSCSPPPLVFAWGTWQHTARLISPAHANAPPPTRRRTAGLVLERDGRRPRAPVQPGPPHRPAPRGRAEDHGRGP